MAWETKKLGDVLDVLKNGINCKQDKSGLGDKITRIETIAFEKIDLNRVGYCKLDNNKKEVYKLQKGDILFSHINSPAHLGKTAIYNLDNEVYHGVNLLLMRPKEFLFPEYFEYFLKSLYWSGYWKSRCKQSINQASVNQQDVKKVEIKYPDSLEEQKQIVKILNETFESISKSKEAAEKNLENVKELFESYLEGVSSKKEEIGEYVTIKTGKLDSNAAEKNGKYPFFTCSRKIFAINSYAFDCEAILLAGNNASGDFNVKHYNGKFNAYQRTYVITINNESELNYRYLYFQMLKSLKEFKRKSVGAGTKFLKIGMIKSLSIPFPSISEQKQIVSKLDALSKEIKELKTIYEQKVLNLDELKKSILKKAFAGELTK